jgi:hypothetical protein
VPVRLTEVIVDCHDLKRLASFWCAALGYVRLNSGDGWLAIGPSGPEVTDQELIARPQPPNMAFVVVPEHKVGKNRVHIDVTPIEASQAEEVERLVGLGATRTDIGQGDEAWVVMADPEGNEFCVMPELEAD